MLLCPEKNRYLDILSQTSKIPYLNLRDYSYFLSKKKEKKKTGQQTFLPPNLTPSSSFVKKRNQEKGDKVAH
jgi:hypothetical protein